MAIAPIGGLSTYSPISSIQPMNYAVQNQAEVSDVYAEDVTRNTAGVNGASPVQYPNATIKTEPVARQGVIDPTEMLEQKKRAASAYNDIASQFKTNNTGYSRSGIGNSYGMAGSRFDAFV